MDKKGYWLGGGLIIISLVMLAATIFISPDGKLDEGRTSVFFKSAGGEETPDVQSGYFRDADVLGGWEYVDGARTVTAFYEKTYIGKNGVDSQFEANFFPAQEWVKEDGILKNKREARSLKGTSYVIKRLEDDGQHDMEYVDWNLTSVTFKAKVKDSKKLNKDIPIKKNGLTQETVKLTSLSQKSGLITIQHEGGNWSFGEHSTSDYLGVDNNDSFKDARINSGGTADYNYGTTTSLQIFGENATALFGIDLFGMLGAITIDEFVFDVTYAVTIYNTPIIEYHRIDGRWDEGYQNGAVGNSSSNCPYTEAVCPDYAWIYNSYFSAEDVLNNSYQVTAVGRYTYIFDPAVIQKDIDAEQNVSFMANNSIDVTGIDQIPSLESADPWGVNLTYTAANIFPVCTESGINITVLEDSGQWLLDTNMSEPINISCTDADNDPLTYTIDEPVAGAGTYGTFTNPDNDDLIFTTAANQSGGTDIVIVNVSDGTDSILTAAQVTITAVNDNVSWAPINNNTYKIEMNDNKYLSPNLNLSGFFLDFEQNATPTNITIQTNNSDVDCYMATDNPTGNFTVFCQGINDFTGPSIVTVNGTDLEGVGGSSAVTSFEMITNGLPENITTTPTNNTLNDTMPVELGCLAEDAELDTLFYTFETGTDPSTLVEKCAETGGECAVNDTINGWYYWRCFANDTFSSSNWTDVQGIRVETWDVIDFNESITPVSGFFFEGEAVVFSANISWNEIRYDEIVISLNFTNQSFDLIETQYDNYTNFYTTVSLPDVDGAGAPVQVDWNWEINLTYEGNNSIYENNSYTGNINVTEIYTNIGCNGSNATDSLILNVSFWDETNWEEFNFVNSTNQNNSDDDWVEFNYYIDFYTSNPTINTTIQGMLTNISNFNVCTEINITLISFGNIEYWKENYDHRHNYFIRRVFDNVTDDIRLFLIKPATTTFIEGGSEITPTVQDCDGNFLKGYLIYSIDDYDNLTRPIMEMSYVSGAQKGTAYLQKGYTSYWTQFKTEDGTYKTLRNTVEAPATINSLTPQYYEECEIDDWETYYDIQTQLTWIEDSFVLSSEIPAGEEVRFLVKRIGNDTTVICDYWVGNGNPLAKCNFTTLGYINDEGNYFATVSAYGLSGNYTQVIDQATKNILDTIKEAVWQKAGAEGVIAVYLLTGTLTLAGASVSPVVGIILLVFGVIGAWLMDFMFIPASAILVLCVMAGWVIYRMRR